MSDPRRRLLELFKARAVAFGDFTLASGKKSSYYINSKKVLFHGDNYTSEWHQEAEKRGLPNLKCLVLSGSPVGDDALAALEGFATLESVNLAGTKVTDRAIEHLARIPHLRILNLASTDLTDQGVAGLSTFPALEGLDLQATSLTDQGLSQLSGAARLSSLGLAKTAIRGPSTQRLNSHVAAVRGRGRFWCGAARNRSSVKREGRPLRAVAICFDLRKY